MDVGPAERELGALARRYAVLTRAIVAAGCIALGLAVVPGPRPVLAAAGMLALLAWILRYTTAMLRSPRAWLVTVDLALVCVAALGERWTVLDAVDADGTGWALAVVTVTAVAVQWHTPLWAGTVAFVALVGAYVAGAWLAVGAVEAQRLPAALWVLPMGAMSRVCYVVLIRAGRRSDAMLAERERHRQDLAVSAARRADEREQQALLHDTVAATLLMVGLGTVPGPRTWLADQAGRDLLVLRRQVGPAAPTDLADLLAAEVSGSPVPVRHAALPSVALPSVAADAIAGSVREALRNVARHAGVDHATLTVSVDPLRVDILDDGRGFDPQRVPEHRRGVAASMVERMATAGGRATIRSSPGNGTLVRLEWPHAPHPGAPEQPERSTAIGDRLADGLRRGMFGVPVLVLALDAQTLLGDAADYRPLWGEVLAFAVLAAVTAVAAFPVLRGRPWGVLRWPLLTAALAAHVMATAAVVPAALSGTAQWSWETFGWWAVLLLLDRPWRYLVCAVVVYFGVTVGQVVAAGRADARTLVGMSTLALVLGGMQLSLWLLGAGTRRTAAVAEGLAAEGERLRTAERVAEQIHRDRHARYAELTGTAGTLLAGLAAGELDPGRPAVRQSCLIEAARIRRLLAEGDDSGDPLVHELTACTDLAARRGVVVQFAVRGERPAVPRPVRRALTEPVLLALATAVSAARVTVVAMPDRVVVSAVTDGEPSPDVTADGPVRVTWSAQGGTVWMEATWTMTSAPGRRPQSVGSGAVR